MRVLWIDASAGAAGDMLLAALVDAGASLAAVRRALSGLPVSGYTLGTRRIVRAGLAGRRIEVRVREAATERGLAQVERIVRAGKLAPGVRDRALRVFRRLVEAEARAHGTTARATHLHEVGGVDAIVDVVGACVALDELGIERVVVSPMTTGYGTVRCAHGVYPIPGPATTLLVHGTPIRGGEIEAERLTPTGAALLTTWADDWGGPPAMRPQAVGYGAGASDFGTDPNMLRVLVGQAERSPEPPGPGPEIVVLECVLDDVSPQVLAFACERALGAGALDVFTSAVTMKKGRSGHCITALARPESFDAVARSLLRETSSLGLRYRSERRIEVERVVRAVPTRWGPVRVKVGRLDDREIRISPEYDDCAAIARRERVPLAVVEREALAAHRRGARTRRNADGVRGRSPRERR
jgi:pyridinium-3,5-bisthiocarboxylic acid mononucleotide nickel chelatase